ncbi:MAG: hypothetical protein ACTHM2_18880 [Afipia sp.]
MPATLPGLFASALLASFVLSGGSHQARAQDVVGIEICTAEKTMERRTSCLQSNINFLKASLTKASLEHQQKLDAANRQIEALKATVAGLQKAVSELQAKAAAAKNDAANDKSKAKDATRDQPAK